MREERLIGVASAPLIEEVYPHGHRAPTDEAAAREIVDGWPEVALPADIVQLAERVYFAMVGTGSAGQKIAAGLIAEALIREREEAFKDGFEAGRAVGIAQAAGIIPHPEV